MSPADTTVKVAVPDVARSPAAPVMLTWSAPVVDHVAVTVSGEQPLEGEIVKEVMTGAVEKAPRETDSARLLPSLGGLSFLIAYGRPAPVSMRKRSARCDFSAAAGTSEASDCCPTEPGMAKSWGGARGGRP